jgi:predicted RNase H-like nuclease (RuvC/YqgF family)
MTALELFAILVLAGAVIVLLYYYLRDRSISLETMKTDATNLGQTVRTGASDLSGKVAGERHMQGMGEKLHVSEVSEKVSGMGEKMNVSGVSEKVSGVGKSLKGKVKEVPISTDVLSGKIDQFLDEKSDQLIKDWELATKKDINQLEKKFNKVTTNIHDLERRFNEYRGHSNKKFENIEKRLTALESEKK